MNGKEFRETPEFQKGRTGERIVADFLQGLGYYIIPSYDYAGEDGDKAPKLQGLTAGFAVPDLDIAREGKRKWCEVKTKQSASWTRITNRFEHGIPERHLRNYLKVQEITGTPVYLVVYEQDTSLLLVIAVNDVAQAGRRSTMKKQGREEGGMVYFARDSMRTLANLAVPPSAAS